MLIGELLEGMNPAWRDEKARLSIHAFRRHVFPSLIRHFTARQRRAAVLVGPRQVGKTTLLKQIADDLVSGHGVPPPNVTYFDFSDERLPARMVSPRDIVSFVPPRCDEKKPRYFLFDEISKYERWAEWLKQAVDHAEGHFLVTDSVSTLLRKGGRESGLGRWDEYSIEALSLREFLGLLRPDFPPRETLLAEPQSLALYLNLGGRPEFARAPSVLDARGQIRDDISDRAIRRDLLHHNVDVERVRELLVYLIEDSGEIFNADKRVRLLQRPGASPLDPRTLQKWIGLLNDTMLIVPLFPFAKAPTARLSARSHPKLYASDHGLITAFSTLAEPLSDSRTLGRVYEAVVYRHLREAAKAAHLNLSYLRPKDGRLEIDFVVSGDSPQALVEVTSSQDPREKMGKLRSNSGDFGNARRVVVHGGRERRRDGDLWLAPLDEFLLDPAFWIGEA